MEPVKKNTDQPLAGPRTPTEPTAASNTASVPPAATNPPDPPTAAPKTGPGSGRRGARGPDKKKRKPRGPRGGRTGGREAAGTVVAVWRKIGAPALFETPQLLAERIDQYFASCEEDGTRPLVSGLALFCGYSTKQQLDGQCARGPEFSALVKTAKLAIESSYEARLDRDRPAGAIFALKNMGWTDQRSVEFTGSLTNIDLSKLPDVLIERIVRGEDPRAAIASWLAERDADVAGLLGPGAPDGASG